MSYNRSYSETITVNGSKSISLSYPPSENGGTVSGTVYYTESVPVHVNIHVNTIPFDSRVAECNNDVNILTGAVVATEAAQIASIEKNARKVAGSIIEGFFKNARFEISSQITELTQKIDAHLMHLHELAKQLRAIKEQMERDYNRTANRYTKIFSDYNNELSNRIHQLNKPAFTFKQQTDEHAVRSSESELINTVAVFGSESGGLQAKISASIAKKRTLDAINQANTFLRKQKKLERTINRSMQNGNKEAIRFSPVCFIETTGEQSQVDRFVYKPDYLPEIQKNNVFESLASKQWEIITKEKKEMILPYFNSELHNTYSSASPRNDRVKETIMKLLDFNTIKSL